MTAAKAPYCVLRWLWMAKARPLLCPLRTTKTSRLCACPQPCAASHTIQRSNPSEKASLALAERAVVGNCELRESTKAQTKHAAWMFSQSLMISGYNEMKTFSNSDLHWKPQVSRRVSHQFWKGQEIQASFQREQWRTPPKCTTERQTQTQVERSTVERT